MNLYRSNIKNSIKRQHNFRSIGDEYKYEAVYNSIESGQNSPKDFNHKRSLPLVKSPIRGKNSYRTHEQNSKSELLYEPTQQRYNKF